MPEYIQALSLNRDIVPAGDLNCDLWSPNPRGEALKSFYTAVNATQLINKSSTL